MTSSTDIAQVNMAYADMRVQRGASFPLGATLVNGGVNFSVFAQHSGGAQLLLFDHVEAPKPSRVIDLYPRVNRTYHYCHAFVSDITARQGSGIAVFRALFEQDVGLERMLLKPNMVIGGKECPHHNSVKEVATATLRCLRRHVPAAVPGIVFLSGGQEDRVATAHLDAINRLPLPKPWGISFSCGRALQDLALEAWHGRDENLEAGEEALYHRARCNSAASLGRYTAEMEKIPVGGANPPDRREWRDD